MTIATALAAIAVCAVGVGLILALVHLALRAMDQITWPDHVAPIVAAYLFGSIALTIGDAVAHVLRWLI